MPDTTPEPEAVAVYYDLDVHLAGQRYLLQRHDDGPGYATIPITDEPAPPQPTFTGLANVHPTLLPPRVLRK